ncbi:hypothetical protein JCM33374_g6387 [Metschnikowia sp. JCM 33374]|nr:hypothetical protein JCM33374_g6387 [Metschnikowia sp. JCM 33374]
MGKNSNYENQREYSARSQTHYQSVVGSEKRIWIKRITGYPTSILMNRFDIVDDLKTAVFQKYPNTIARLHDSSDIQVFVSTSRREQIQQSKNLKNKAPINRLKGESNDELSYRNSVHNELNSGENVLALLEPDKNVWDALDEYFGGEMKMSDAFVIDVLGEQSHISLNQTHLNSQKLDELRLKDTDQTYSPSPSQYNSQRLTSVTSNLQTPKPQNPQQFSKSLVLEKHSPDSLRFSTDASPMGSTHKRSQSSPSQSPISLTSQSKNNNSQAVLLLPKNFSLGEQNSLKRSSLDESIISKPNHKKNSNVTNIGGGVSEKRSIIGKESPRAVNQYGTLQSSTGTMGHPSSSKHGHKESSSEGKSEISIMKRTTDRKRENTEKTLNTSTFEQVLPSISVLVVEDNSINQAILGAFLRKHKIHYQIAKNGQEAVDKWRKGGFHLVLMDIQLPVKSGIEATKEIRFLERVNRIGVFAQHELNNNQATGQIKIREDQKLDLNVFRSPVIIVALTASSNSSVDKKNALTAGCNDFLTKPVNLVWLQNKITEWGCMQALIDFDGWRCKGNSSTSPSVKSLSSA